MTSWFHADECVLALSAILPPYPESLSRMAWRRAADSEVEPEPTVMYCGRLGFRRGWLGCEEDSSWSDDGGFAGSLPLPWYSWLIVRTSAKGLLGG